MQEFEKKHVVKRVGGENAVPEKSYDLAGHWYVEKTVVRQILENLGGVIEHGQFRQSGHEYTQSTNEGAAIQLRFYVHEQQTNFI